MKEINTIELFNDSSYSDEKLFKLLDRCYRYMVRNSSIKDYKPDYEWSRMYVCSIISFVSRNIPCLISVCAAELELKLTIQGY